jgi:hypothetical protein
MGTHIRRRDSVEEHFSHFLSLDARSPIELWTRAHSSRGPVRSTQLFINESIRLQILIIFCFSRIAVLRRSQSRGPWRKKKTISLVSDKIVIGLDDFSISIDECCEQKKGEQLELRFFVSLFCWLSRSHRHNQIVIDKESKNFIS